MKRPKQGGRKKGSLNKRTKLVEEIAEKFQIDPFEVLMHMAAGNWKELGYEAECYFSEKPDGAVKMGYVISPEMRLKAAQEATKYLYSQKQAVTLETGDKGIRVIIEDYSLK